jgi:hypothetical protein
MSLDHYNNTVIGHLSEGKAKLTYQYGKLAERLLEIRKVKATWWKAQRPTHTSNASAERAWDETDYGQEEAETRMRMTLTKMKRGDKQTEIDASRDEWYHPFGS